MMRQAKRSVTIAALLLVVALSSTLRAPGVRQQAAKDGNQGILKIIIEELEIKKISIPSGQSQTNRAEIVSEGQQ